MGDVEEGQQVSDSKPAGLIEANRRGLGCCVAALLLLERVGARLILRNAHAQCSLFGRRTSTCRLTSPAMLQRGISRAPECLGRIVHCERPVEPVSRLSY